jgi:hypothetical protein
VVLHHSFINLIHELDFVLGVGAGRVQMFRFTGKGVVINVAADLVWTIGIVGASDEEYNKCDPERE